MSVHCSGGLPYAATVAVQAQDDLTRNCPLEDRFGVSRLDAVVASQQCTAGVHRIIAVFHQTLVDNYLVLSYIRVHRCETSFRGPADLDSIHTGQKWMFNRLFPLANRYAACLMLKEDRL